MDQQTLASLFLLAVRGTMARAITERGLPMADEQTAMLNNANPTMRELSDFFFDLGFTIDFAVRDLVDADDGI